MAGFQIRKRTVVYILVVIAVIVIAIVGIAKLFNIDLLQTSNYTGMFRLPPQRLR